MLTGATLPSMPPPADLFDAPGRGVVTMPVPAQTALRDSLERILRELRKVVAPPGSPRPGTARPTT
jgi:hypothetical protein